MKKILPILLLGFIFVSCFNSHFKIKDICGNYTLQSVMLSDTVTLYPDFVYKRYAYDENNQLIFVANGKWDITPANTLNFKPEKWKMYSKQYAYRYVRETLPRDSVIIEISNGAFAFKLGKQIFNKIRNS